MSLKSLKDFGNYSETTANGAVARNVLHEELGYYGEMGQEYRLSKQTSDILLAHARQDAAHALANTTTLLKQVDELKQYMRLLVGAATIAAIVFVVVAYRS